MKVLFVDLTRKRFWFENYDAIIGGVELGSKIFEELVDKNVDPLSPENIITFCVGELSSYFPMASKTVAIFKSPLTNNYAETYAGGRLATAIKSCNIYGIVILGKSDIPIYLVIKENGVSFKDARAFWNMKSIYSVFRIIKENVGGEGIRSILAIGRAGEKRIKYACVTVDAYRHFGRLGLGAVFGSKNLKAIVIYGKKNKKIKNIKKYREVYDKIFKLSVETPLMKKYHEIGTSINVKALNKIEALPTRNLKSNKFEHADEISGEEIAKKMLGRRLACSSCPVACIHLAAIREEYEDEPYFYKTKYVSYDYEPIYSLGSMLGIKDSYGLMKLIEKVEEYGLDAMSTGVILAWATEAYERNAIKKDETLVELSFGNYHNYLKAIDYIVSQPNDFYKNLEHGLNYLKEIYPETKDYALVFLGNEMPGYLTGYGSVINYVIGIRHSHLDNAGYSFDQKNPPENLDPKYVVDKLVEEEIWRNVLNSLIVCLFAREIYKEDIVRDALEAMGKSLSIEEIKNIGRDTYFRKLKMKKRMGYDVDNVFLPKRILEVKTLHGYLNENFIRRALKYFKESYLEK